VHYDFSLAGTRPANLFSSFTTDFSRLIVGAIHAEGSRAALSLGGSAMILKVLQITQYLVKVVPGPDIQVPEIGYKDGNIALAASKSMDSMRQDIMPAHS